MAARMLLVKKIILVLLMLILGTGTCFAQTAGRNFLLYDLQMRYGGTFPLVTSLAEHLGHFEEDYVLVAVDDWQPGLLQDADTIVYAGLQQRKLPRELVEEIAGARQVLWFEDNIEQLAEVKGWHDFRSLGKVSDWTYINFKGRSFYDWMSVEYTDPGKNVNVIATAKKFIDEVPVIWQRENIYYSGMLEFNELFDDYMGYLLHQVFKRHTDDQRPKAFLRVEDVSSIVAPKAVKAVVEKIEKYNIPFAIGVVPVGIMDGKKHYLHEREELVEVLTAENADGGILKAELPVLPANQQGWRVRFAFYHDLGIIDCSKRYDDVAWSVIEKETSIYLAVSSHSRQESLADFPGYFNTDSNGDIVLTMWLSQTPDNDELTAAAQLAYWIGQNNTGNIVWKVQLGPQAVISNDSGTVITTGQNRVLTDKRTIGDSLPVTVNADGTIKTSEWLSIATDAIDRKNIFQVARKGDNVIYAFTYANIENMKSFMRLAFINGTSLNGQVALIDANGQTLTFAEEVKHQDAGLSKIFRNFSGNRLGSYLAVIAVVVCGTLIMMWYSKRRK